MARSTCDKGRRGAEDKSAQLVAVVTRMRASSTVGDASTHVTKCGRMIRREEKWLRLRYGMVHSTFLSRRKYPRLLANMSRVIKGYTACWKLLVCEVGLQASHVNEGNQ